MIIYTYSIVAMVSERAAPTVKQMKQKITFLISLEWMVSSFSEKKKKHHLEFTLQSFKGPYLQGHDLVNHWCDTWTSFFSILNKSPAKLRWHHWATQEVYYEELLNLKSCSYRRALNSSTSHLVTHPRFKKKDVSCLFTGALNPSWFLGVGEECIDRCRSYAKQTPMFFVWSVSILTQSSLPQTLQDI